MFVLIQGVQTSSWELKIFHKYEKKLLYDKSFTSTSLIVGQSLYLQTNKIYFAFSFSSITTKTVFLLGLFNSFFFSLNSRVNNFTPHSIVMLLLDFVTKFSSFLQVFLCSSVFNVNMEFTWKHTLWWFLQMEWLQIEMQNRQESSTFKSDTLLGFIKNNSLSIVKNHKFYKI